MTKTHSELLKNIPPELAEPKVWLQYYERKDSKCPTKKPSKCPTVKFGTDAEKAANCRTLPHILTERAPQAGVQRLVMKDEGFVFVDLDGVRNPETEEVAEWARELIERLDSYTEISASGKGFHVVVRGSLPEDLHLDKNPVEIYSGNIPNKLMAMTGNLYGLREEVEERQQQAEQLLRDLKGKTPPEALAALAAPIDWRKDFHTLEELPDGDITWLIEGVLPEGVGFIGALSGAGKTWFALSMARALSTGQKFLGNYKVPEPVPVLYLCPEMSDKTFKKRGRLFGIPMNGDMFRCRTIADGVPIPLKDPRLVAAVRELKPVIFLDTALRFSLADDENDAAQHARGLGNAIFTLKHMGARAVVALDHRSKKGAEQNEMTLENALRGSGDIGAICDATWCLQLDKGDGGQYAKDSKKSVRLIAKCCKMRDAVELDEFRVQLFPHIETIGDFGVLDGTPETVESEKRQSEVNKLAAAIRANPRASLRELEDATGVGKNRISKVIAELWHHGNGIWLPTAPESAVQGLPL